MAVFHQSILSTPNDLFIVGGVSISSSSTATRNLSITSHQIGDMIIAMTSIAGSAAPALLSGYTNIVVSNGSGATVRSIRLQFKFATSSTESITYSGGKGYMIAVRNATRIGQVNTINQAVMEAANTRWSIPDLSNLNDSNSKLIIAGSYEFEPGATFYGTPTSPYIRFTTSNNNVCFVYANKNNQTSLTSKSCSCSFTMIRNHYAIEIL